MTYIAKLNPVTGLPATRGGSPLAIPSVAVMTGEDISDYATTPLSPADIAASTSPFADPMKQAAGRASQAQGGLGSLSTSPLSGGAFGSILSILRGDGDSAKHSFPMKKHSFRQT